MFNIGAQMTQNSNRITAASWTRRAMAIGLSATLAACTVIPKGPKAPRPRLRRRGAAARQPAQRYRPASRGPAGAAGRAQCAAGQALANASTMALLDMNASNLRITTYDTSAAPPLRREGLGRWQPPDPRASAGRGCQRGGAGDPRLACAGGVLLERLHRGGWRHLYHGHHPGPVDHPRGAPCQGLGVTRFAALVPLGTYGERASTAMVNAVRNSGGQLVGIETYGRDPASIAAAVRKLKAHGAFDAVLVGDTARAAAQAAPLLKAGKPTMRILGTELWSGEALLARTPALRGSLYAALSDTHFRQFSDRYHTRYGEAPYRIATMGYDSVLLTLRIAREWQPGRPFPTQRLYDKGGFAGTDGIFRFNSTNVIERSLEVREVKAVPGSTTSNTVPVVSPAPARFDD
jgi:hypothetical protein